MKYNDFPILSNEDYFLLNNFYNTTQKPDRKNIVFRICKELNNVFHSCFQLNKNYNLEITLALESTKETALKISNNLCELFNFDISTSQLPRLNIFSLTKRISQTISLFLNWISFEEKEYYKNLAQKYLLELLECLNKILTALEFSNIKIFKHM